jgi:hypothetical protein
MTTTALLSSYSNIFQCLEERDSIYIQQMGTGRECIEVMTGCEMSNRFEIKADYDSVPFFKLAEDSNCIVRQCCKGIYPFDMNLTLPNDTSEEPQIIYHRDFHCSNVKCLCPCGWMCNFFAYDCCFGRQVLDIMSRDRQLLGRVKEEPRAWCGVTNWGYYDELDQGKFMCTITVCEMCKICCCQDVVFDCTRYGDEEVVATLTRKCVCTAVNVATEKDHFQMDFNASAGLNAMEKFSLMSIVILVKYMHFEQQE